MYFVMAKTVLLQYAPELGYKFCGNKNPDSLYKIEIYSFLNRA